ncbi:Uma2 family endonuclease [Sphingobacteriales bacterium UPWRP_1]|nr:restriction endonuclease [Sphingobacteriales bacterium TSM_CSM]PSJ72013.1 Uma2 family endonuclease [Sphingobacteriales bacterium UPWRP_1]
MITDITAIDPNRRYSYADYLQWTFEEQLELIKGKIFKMSPAPNRRHQQISGELFRQIANYLYKKNCKVFDAPFDVRLPDKKKSSPDNQIFTVVQPDICIICDPAKLDERGCLGAPDFIIEIVSPATIKKDLNEKYRLYEESGVREYWIVQPNDQTVTVFTLSEAGQYQLRKIYSASEEVPVNIFPGFSIHLEEVFSE